MALFSTLLQANATTTVSSSAIPEFIQLYQGKAILLDPATSTASNMKVPKHGTLSYQAIEVHDDELIVEDEGGGLFRRKSKTNVIVKPNLGVWNAMVVAASSSSSNNTDTVDKLLRIPSTSSHYCFTVDLSKPSEVEPTMAALHSTLVRLVIEKPPSLPEDDDDKASKAATTTLAKLRTTQFGLANEDEQAKEKTSTTTAEEEEKVKFALMICALVAPPPAIVTDDNDTYKEKQAQALVLYHLRKYAAALQATLVFVRDWGEATASAPAAASVEKVEPEEGEQASMSLTQLSRVWKSWSTNDGTLSITDDPAMYGPSVSSSAPATTSEEEEGADAAAAADDEDLIETALLRNANYPGQWDAAKDSLWKALPCASALEAKKDASDEAKEKDPAGDNHWLAKLRDSIDAGQPSGATTPPASQAASKQAPKADTASFFENLLK